MNKTINMIFVVLVLISFTISDFYTKQDINDVAYVVGIGIDVGEKNDLKLSFQLSVPSKNTTEGSSSEGSDTVIDTVESASLESGIGLANRIY